MRRKGLTSDADQDKVVAAARKFENLPYDNYSAADSGMYGNKRNQILAALGCTTNIIGCTIAFKAMTENAKEENADKKLFCSELVSRAFTIAGFPIVEGSATKTNPCAVYNSSWLEYVGHLPTKDLNKGTNLSEEQKERNRRSSWRQGN